MMPATWRRKTCGVLDFPSHAARDGPAAQARLGRCDWRRPSGGVRGLVTVRALMTARVPSGGVQGLTTLRALMASRERIAAQPVLTGRGPSPQGTAREDFESGGSSSVCRPPRARPRRGGAASLRLPWQDAEKSAAFRIFLPILQGMGQRRRPPWTLRLAVTVEQGGAHGLLLRSQTRSQSAGPRLWRGKEKCKLASSCCP